MKFTVTSVLVAALAALSSAAVTPLPQKFTLVVSPSTSGTPLDGEPTQITTDASVPQRFNFGSQPPPYYAQASLVVTKDTAKNTFYIVEGGHTLADLQLDNSGAVFFNYWDRASSPAGAWSQLNGGLAYDAKNGKGAQALWQACARGNASSNWTILFNPAPGGFYEGLCYPVTLKVVAL